MSAVGKTNVAQKPSGVRVRSSQKQQAAFAKSVAYILLTLGGITMVVPFIWMIATSFKTAAEIFEPGFFPAAPTIENYREVIFNTAFPRWYVNSFIVAVLTTASVVFFDALIGFVFAKYNFPFKNVIFVAILSTLMVPTEMLVIPWYMMSVNGLFGQTWVDTYWGIAFPGIITAAGAFFSLLFFRHVDSSVCTGTKSRSNSCANILFIYIYFQGQVS